MADLGQSINDLGDLFTKLGLDVVDGNGRVFHYVVDQPTCDGSRIQLEVDQNLCDFDAMRDVPVSRQAFLALVSALAETIGAHEQVPVQTFREPLLEPGWQRFLLFDCASRHNSPASAKLI